MPVVNLAVEGTTDLAVVSKILEDVGLELGNAYGQQGKAHLDSRLAGYNNSARFRPWIVVRDLDHDAICAATLVSSLLPKPAEFMRLRIASRAIESWLLADPKMLARFFSIGVSLIPIYPDELDDPKATLISLARHSRKRQIVDAMVPRQGSLRRVGPGYGSLIARFAATEWRPRVAALRSHSLARCIARIKELGPREI
ncbi:MAG: hypothetical protein R2745_21650 [Vicinamibacterales bacterium]